MPLPRTAGKTPTSAGRIIVSLVDPTGIVADRRVEGRVQVLDQNGELLTEWQGDLIPQLSQPQLNALSGFMDAMRIKAAELLP